MQLSNPAIKPTRRGHNFDSTRHRGKHRVSPLPTVDPLESTTPPSEEKVWCPKCEKCHAVAVDYQYTRRVDGTRKYVHRVGYCDGCEMVYFWRQYCNNTGTPVGRPLKGSLVTNDRASVVEKVLRVYPQLRGTEDAYPHY